MTSHPIHTLLASILLTASATAETSAAPAPFLPVPKPAQLRWHRAEYIMFAHFGMKTSVGIHSLGPARGRLCHRVPCGWPMADGLLRQKIGYKRIIFAGRSSAKDPKPPPCDAVRLRIDKALACPLINNFQIIGTEP
jgi:hypothetical protein